MEPGPHTNKSSSYSILSSMFGGHFKFYHVYDKDGNVIVSKETEAEAIDYLEKLKRKDGVQTTPSPDLGSVAPDPSLGSNAFDVISFGQGAGYGTLDKAGQIDPKFHTTRQDAERYAAAARAKHEQQVAALQSIAASRQSAPLPPGAARPSQGSAATRAAMGWGPRRGTTPASGPADSFTPTRPSRLDPAGIDLSDAPISTSAGGPAGLGAAGPKLGQLANALGKAADALAGVANASQGIPLSPAPVKPTPAQAPVPAWKRAIDSLGAAMAPVFGKPGDIKGLTDAFKGFRATFARGFGPSPVYPTQAPVGGQPQPGLYPRPRPTPGSPGPVSPGTYGLGTPGAGNTTSFFQSFGQSIASHFRQAMGGLSPGNAWQAARGFASNLGHAFHNPAGGIPLGTGGWVGQAARQGVTGLGQAAGSFAQRAAAGVQAAFQAGQGGAGAAGIAKAFAGGAGLGTIAGAVGSFVGVAGAAGSAAKEFFELTLRMRAFADSVVEGNRGLARYNGAIASAYIGLGIHDFHRELAFGRATQGTAITAVRAVDAMRDDWQQFDIFKANTTNRAAGFAAGFSGGAGQFFGQGATAVDAALNQVDPNGVVSAGAGAGLWAGIQGFNQGFYNSFLNNPVTSILMPWTAFKNALNAGQSAASAAADAKVVQLAAGATDSNFWGAALHGWANQGGPLTRRPTPRR